MNPAEAAVLLAAISANDNREVTEAGARAMSAAIPDVELADALEWLPGFYRAATRDTKNWIYGGDVLAGVIALHVQRRSDARARARAEAVANMERRAIEGDVDVDASPADAELAVYAYVTAEMKRYDEEHLPQCSLCRDIAERESRRAS